MCIYQLFKNDIMKNIQIPYVDLPNLGDMLYLCLDRTRETLKCLSLKQKVTTFVNKAFSKIMTS